MPFAGDAAGGGAGGAALVALKGVAGGKAKKDVAGVGVAEKLKAGTEAGTDEGAGAGAGALPPKMAGAGAGAGAAAPKTNVGCALFLSTCSSVFGAALPAPKTGTGAGARDFAAPNTKVGAVGLVSSVAAVVGVPPPPKVKLGAGLLANENGFGASGANVTVFRLGSPSAAEGLGDSQLTHLSASLEFRTRQVSHFHSPSFGLNMSPQPFRSLGTSADGPAAGGSALSAAGTPIGLVKFRGLGMSKAGVELGMSGGCEKLLGGDLAVDCGLVSLDMKSKVAGLSVNSPSPTPSPGD